MKIRIKVNKTEGELDLMPILRITTEYMRIGILGILLWIQWKKFSWQK